ncbi:MAG: phenylacetate--CoA ligase, partial [Syntrophomonadaceae bacterium]|nr:phenylacetate--CoA ligase [Syntrophomonadaceae bacterium]
MIWSPEIECAPREKIVEIQRERMKKSLRWAYERVPFYREAFRRVGFEPGDFRDFPDLRRLPFTTKDDLRANYPYGMFAVPLEEIVRVHASSGTTGKPSVVGYTKNDMEIWTDLVARMVTMAGVTRGDIAQIAFSYGLFTGAFGLHYGLERAGASVIPVSGGNTEKQIMLMQDFGTTALICTPTYALHMAEVAEDLGVDLSRLKLRLGLFGAEAWTEGFRQEIESRWRIKATDNYGLSEIMGPGVSGECEYTCGMHIAEDHIYWEVIDPESGEVLEPGREGELVLTTLTKEGIPVIRYRTKDITSITLAPCACGRTTARMAKVTGRTDDMLIIRGVNVFPSQIETVLAEMEGVQPQYLITVTRRGYLDELEIQVELAPNWFTGKYRDLEELERRLTHRMQSVLFIRPRIKLLEPRSLERTVGKATRVRDLRPR